MTNQKPFFLALPHPQIPNRPGALVIGNENEVGIGRPTKGKLLSRTRDHGIPKPVEESEVGVRRKVS